MVVVYLSLLHVIFFSDIIHASEKAKFGCNFDENYNLQNPPKESGKIHIDPVWSETEIQTVIFKDEAELKEFLKKLNEVNDYVLKNNSYNTLDNLLDFWDAYRTYGRENKLICRCEKCLNKFFQGYQEKTTPKDGAFFTIELTNRMIEMYPKFADKMRLSYLSTCSIATQYDLEWDAFLNEQISNDTSNLPFDHFHDHVMGFMKFEIGENSGITGVVVMDPGMALNYIIVLTKEYHYFMTTHSIGTTRYHDGRDHFYYHVGSYIGVASQKPAIKSVVTYNGHTMISNARNTDKPVVNQLCYIKKSYCSFQETTRKPWLTALDHSIMFNDRDGEVDAGLSLKLFDHMEQKAGLEIWFRKDKKAQLNLVVLKLNEMRTYLEKIKRYSPEDFDMWKNKDVEILFLAAKFFFGNNKEEIIGLMEKIVKMFEDKIFTSQMQKLHDWFENCPHSNAIQPSLDIVY